MFPSQHVVLGTATGTLLIITKTGITHNTDYVNQICWNSFCTCWNGAKLPTN